LARGFRDLRPFAHLDGLRVGTTREPVDN
jgi:hypothetical protein